MACIQAILLGYALISPIDMATAATVYFQFDTLQGDRQWGPNMQYPFDKSMPSALGNVTVSDGTSEVNGNAIPRGMQIWTVGADAWYDIVAAGASGSDYTKYNPLYGGRGVAVATKYYLLAGETVIVLVGAHPAGCWSSKVFGGGGGSFVSKYAATSAFSTPSQHTLLLVGGGGGSSCYPGRYGGDATTSTTGGRCQYNPDATTALATNGGGGGASALAGGDGVKGSSSDADGNGAGGGGFLADGGDGSTKNTATKTIGGNSFLNGGMGGRSYMPRSADLCYMPADGPRYPNGGFGGGGGSYMSGAGGGGYSGGQGCHYLSISGGGGGGSYDVNGVGNAATLYASWDINKFGPAPTGYSDMYGYVVTDGYSNGYISTNGIVAVSFKDDIGTCNSGAYNSGSECIVCAPGKYSAAVGAFVPCQECSAGQYASSPGSTACQDCPPATYISLPGSSACQDCPVGTYESLSGSSACQNCTGSIYIQTP
jgi:hypothetical protein